MVLIGWLGCTPLMAQIDVTFPVSRMVVQRDNNNQATVQIAGSYNQALDAVEARVVSRTANQGTDTNWAVLQANPTNGQFTGTLVVRGGWYKVQVRGLLSGVVVATDEVDRFGVGEVFGIVGHSNAQGSSCQVNNDNINHCPTIDGAADDRVTVVALDPNSPEFQQYEQTADTRFLPGLAFSQLLTFSGMSPFANFAWLWGHMGDVLVQRINVPVLIYNAGFGGTNMEYNYKAAYDIPFQHGFIKYELRMPYANFRNLMNLYVPTTGIRAVLLQHGENDRGNSTESTLSYHYGVIDKSRQEFGRPNLAWIVALSSFVGAPFDNVRQAQLQTINRPNYLAFQGPDLDAITSATDRPDGIHFSPTGQVKAGELWANAITNAYLQTIQPYPAQPQPLASIACTGGNQLLLTQPSNYSVTWNDGSTTPSLTVGPGTYSARLRDAQNRVVFPPAVTVPAAIKPASPAINSANGSVEICQSNGLTLLSTYAGPNLWNTGAASSSITVSSAGTYSVQARNPVYGCLSDAVSKTIQFAGADLTLSLRTSRRIVAVGDTVTFTMTVRNESGCDAGSTTLQNRLPPNLAFVASANGLAVANGIVSGTVPAVPAGGSVSRTYIARLLADGTYRNAAEVSAEANPDPDSQPNSGTGDGQDDAAQSDLRTFGAGSALYSSPNPNQIPLPPVQPNQPAPDPAKADLSLAMQASNRTSAYGQVVSYTLTVQNQGGLTATNISVRDNLPSGLQFVSSASGMSVNGSAVTGTIGQLGVGQSVSLMFSVVVTTNTGVLTNVAQISASGQPDPDSTPNNGTTLGEDDEARTDLRVTGQ